MSDAFDGRRRGLEAEYFHRKDLEAIAKLREKMKVAAEAKAAGSSSMKCPRCDGALKENQLDEVVVDTCKNCGGIWLDSSELERLVGSEGEGFFSRLWNEFANRVATGGDGPDPK
jgi:hypothetical protein